MHGTETPTLPPPPRPPRTRKRTGRTRVAIALGALLLALAAPRRGSCWHRPPSRSAGPEAIALPLAPATRPRPRLTVARPRQPAAPGYVFLAVKRGPGQDGPQIVDDRGRLVWFRPTPPHTTATGFRVQRYRGQPVLTWWQGRTRLGHGMGEYVILDRHYREIARVRAGNGYMGDHHEFQLTPRGTALHVDLRAAQSRSQRGRRQTRRHDLRVDRAGGRRRQRQTSCGSGTAPTTCRSARA